MVRLSIIIPYYKTYELTNKLLYSLIAQDRGDIEIILIDDGCNEERFDEWTGFNNIKIIHQKNGGVSNARNKGIELAQGKYIAFIDSDDMIMTDYVEQLLYLIETRDEDIITFNWLDINTNDVVKQPQNCAVWKSIYKKEILPKFDESLRCREDYFFQKELEKKDPTRYYFDRVLYVYNSGREGSLSWNDRYSNSIL